MMAVRWLPLIEAELKAIALQLDQGFDIAPARRFHLEGLLAAAHADGIALDELLQFCQHNAAAHCTVRIDAQQQSLQLDFWQQRAPVYPSTHD